MSEISQNLINALFGMPVMLCVPVIFVMLFWISFKLRKFYIEKIIRQIKDKHPELYFPDRDK